MNEKIKSRLTKKQLLSIPNILSYCRILLIPAIIILYCSFNLYYWAAGLVVLSGLTDVADGFIARKFNMVTDFGKFIDPVADKLTQAAMVLCAATINWWIVFLLALMIAKDLLLFLWGMMLLKKEDRVSSSRWYGKACTVIIYTVMFALFVYPAMPVKITAILFAICIVVVSLSTILYGNYYFTLFRRKKKLEKNEII